MRFSVVITIRPEGLSKVFIEFREILIVKGGGWRSLAGGMRMVHLGNLGQVIEFAPTMSYRKRNWTDCDSVTIISLQKEVAILKSALTRRPEFCVDSILKDNDKLTRFYTATKSSKADPLEWYPHKGSCH